MGDEADLDVDKETARLITQGLTGVVGELREVGGWNADATSLAGGGFSGLALSPLEAGDGGLADALEGFCERWEWGIRALVADANTLADRLGLAAGMVHEEDTYWATTWKTGLNAVSGNPYATEEEIGRQSYRQILERDDAETAAETLEAGRQMARDWRETGREVVTEGQVGAVNDFVLDRSGLPAEAREGALDEMFGRAPDAPSQPEEQGGGRPSKDEGHAD